MVKFTLTLPIILSSLYISFSQAQNTLSPCVIACVEAAGIVAGCGSCVPSSIRIMPCPCLTRPPLPPRVADLNLIKRYVSVSTPISSHFRPLACWIAVPQRTLQRRKPFGSQCAPPRHEQVIINYSPSIMYPSSIDNS